MGLGRISPRLVNAMIDRVFRQGDQPATSYLPTTMYFALLIAEPYLSGDVYLWDTGNEVTYTNYARLSVARSLAGWMGTQGTAAVSSGTSGQIQPAANQFFGACSTSTQTVTHVALTNSNTRASTGNNALVFWPLDTPFQLVNASPGIIPRLTAAGLTIQLENTP